MRVFTPHTRYACNLGTVYVGPSPFEFERDAAMGAFEGAWKIEHPDTAGRTFRVVGVETRCLQTVRKDEQIGLLVEECGEESQ